MKAKKRTNKKKAAPQRFELNGGDLVVEVDHRGAVYSVEIDGDWDEDKQERTDLLMLELSGPEVDAICKKAAEARQLACKLYEIINNAGTVLRTRANGYAICFAGEDDWDTPDLDIFKGGVNIGCQYIEPADLARVWAASRKARGLR